MLRSSVVLAIALFGVEGCSSHATSRQAVQTDAGITGGAPGEGGSSAGGARATGGAAIGGAPSTGGAFDAGPMDAAGDVPAQDTAPSSNCGDASTGLTLSFDNCIISDVGSVPNANAVQNLSVAAGDLDHDGRIDLVVGTWPDNHVISLKGKGDGSFQVVSTKTVPANPRSITLADLDGDGWLDALVGGSTAAASVSVLLGGAGCSLGDPVTYAGFISAGVAVGDLNGDSVLDVVVGNNYATRYFGSFIGSSSGALSAVSSLPSAMGPRWPVLADFDGDGRLDVLLSADEVDTTGRSSGVVIQRGLGDGTFGAPSGYVSGGTSPWQNLLGDFDCDGHPDVATLDLETNLVTLFLGNGDGTFRTPIQNRVQATTWWAAADFDRDGRLDLVMDAFTNAFYVFRGNGNGTFAQAKSFPANLNDGPMAAADVNGDGKPDVVYAVRSVGAIGEICALLNTSR
jgi:hypothetical protein